MQVELLKKNIILSEKEEDYIYKVINKITKYAKRVADEASQIDVCVESTKLKTTSEKIVMVFNLSLPRNSLVRVEEKGVTVMAAADKAFTELKIQLEKFKSKKQLRKGGRGIKVL